jgi:hypothetical protein
VLAARRNPRRESDASSIEISDRRPRIWAGTDLTVSPK